MPGPIVSRQLQLFDGVDRGEHAEGFGILPCSTPGLIPTHLPHPPNTGFGILMKTWLALSTTIDAPRGTYVSPPIGTYVPVPVPPGVQFHPPIAPAHHTTFAALPSPHHYLRPPRQEPANPKVDGPKCLPGSGPSPAMGASTTARWPFPPSPHHPAGGRGAAPRPAGTYVPHYTGPQLAAEPPSAAGRCPGHLPHRAARKSPGDKDARPEARPLRGGCATGRG